MVLPLHSIFSLTMHILHNTGAALPNGAPFLTLHKIYQLLQVLNTPFIGIFTASIYQKRGKALFSCAVSFGFMVIHI